MNNKNWCDIAAYRERDKLLKSLGFQSYKKYQASPIWKQIRTGVLQANPICYSCERKATQVHHGKYTRDNLLGINQSDLYAVCSKCHSRCEFTEAGEKLKPKKATEKPQKMNSSRFFTPQEFGRFVLYGLDTINDLDAELRQRLEREI